MKGSVDYIFSINTGRCGSHYLSVIFSHVPGCRSFHEPEPVGNGRVMRRYLQGHAGPMKRLAERKARLVQDLRSHCRLYFESNHRFIKGFGW